MCGLRTLNFQFLLSSLDRASCKIQFLHNILQLTTAQNWKLLAQSRYNLYTCTRLTWSWSSLTLQLCLSILMVDLRKMHSKSANHGGIIVGIWRQADAEKKSRRWDHEKGGGDARWSLTDDTRYYVLVDDDWNYYVKLISISFIHHFLCLRISQWLVDRQCV